MLRHSGRLPPVDAHALSKFSPTASRVNRLDEQSLWNLDTGPYRGFRANFTYDVIPIALFQAQIYVTFANEVRMRNSHLRRTGTGTSTGTGTRVPVPVCEYRTVSTVWYVSYGMVQLYRYWYRYWESLR